VNSPPPPIDGTDHNMEVEVVNVTSRVARNNYGITKFVNFDESIHEKQDRFHMECVGRVVAVNQIHWYLKQVSC
jgi:hypothetical protein